MDEKQPKRIIPSLGTYLAEAASSNVIDHVVRVRQHGHGQVNVYIRPMNANGDTLGYVVERGLVYPDPAFNGSGTVAEDDIQIASGDYATEQLCGGVVGDSSEQDADYALVAKVNALAVLVEKTAEASERKSIGTSRIHSVEQVIDALAKRILKDMGEEVEQ